MPLEPISFKCSACTKTSAGELDFSYEGHVLRRGEWRVYVEHEYTNQYASCEHCGLSQHVWPEHSVNEKWEKVGGQP